MTEYIYKCNKCNRTVKSAKSEVYCKKCKMKMKQVFQKNLTKTRNSYGMPIDKYGRPDILRMQHEHHDCFGKPYAFPHISELVAERTPPIIKRLLKGGHIIG